MKPLVSILIPAYNSAPWIADTVKSCLEQTWANKEVIVVDDGSTDQTLAIARQFASKAVTVVTQPNQGASAARNKAFSLCQGDYIQWLDADDLLAPDKTARQMAAIEQCSSKRTIFSCGWGYFMYRPSKAKFSPTALWCDLSPVELLLRRMEQNLHMSDASWLVSRELTGAVGPWNERLVTDDDGEYFCRVILASDGVRFIPEAKALYRIVGSSRVSYIGQSNKKMEAQFLSMKLQIGYLRARQDDERARAACVNFLQTWLIHFYPHRMDIVEQAQRLAAELGGQLQTPKLSWKYAWIQKTLGWSAAQKAKAKYNRVKTSCWRTWDKAMFDMGRRKTA